MEKPETKEISEKEKRIRSITKIYYSNPKVQEAIFSFAKNREVVPRYFEGFGKRPDALQYPSDIMSLVNKGATSLHASEEIWRDPLQINSDMSPQELDELRSSWDLLIDIDSPFLDYSKIAAKLIIKELEKYGMKNYGLKFSGSKGFHIIVPAGAFPEHFNGEETRKMFPEWPRAISEYLMYKIKPEYNKIVSSLNINFEALKERTNLTKSDVTSIICPNCGSKGEKIKVRRYFCPDCRTKVERKNNHTNRRLKCINDKCGGYLEIEDEKEYFFCANCKTSSFDKSPDSINKVTYTKDARISKSLSQDFKEEVSGEKMASLDLVLVASRHLFRMPYSLHEKTSLASIVLTKEQIDSFTPKDANPFKVEIKNFYPKPQFEEAARLLESAVAWKKIKDEKEEKEITRKYKTFEKINFQGVPEELFPKPIKLLLKGLQEGKKRGLFILITFLRSLNFPPEYINQKIREWNKLNSPPLKEGYIKSQIDWHLKQKKQILPPNYKNESFYKDLNLLDLNAMPKDKNPISEVMRRFRKTQK